MNSPGMALLSLEAFANLFSAEFGVSNVLPTSRLVDDLTLDSLDLYRVLVLLEELGAKVDDDRPFDEGVTVAQIYQMYCVAKVP